MKKIKGRKAHRAQKADPIDMQAYAQIVCNEYNKRELIADARAAGEKQQEQLATSEAEQVKLDLVKARGEASRYHEMLQARDKRLAELMEQHRQLIADSTSAAAVAEKKISDLTKVANKHEALVSTYVKMVQELNGKLKALKKNLLP